MDYEEYEKTCAVIRQENDFFLSLFEKDLTTQGLSPKTINKHLNNVDFYLNDYMLYSEARHMEEGISMIDDFLGNFFIRKCMWSTPATIKSTATSIKKFYKCMAENGKIEKDAYSYLCHQIKDNMSDWQADCAQYNDADAPSPFSFI